MVSISLVFFFQAEDGIRDLVRSRGLGDVYKRQSKNFVMILIDADADKMTNGAFSPDGTYVPRTLFVLSLIHI